MPIEKSTISIDEIRRIINERYAIGPVESIESIDGGSANCFLVKSPTGSYILKEFQSKYKPSDVAIEPEINNYLLKQGLPLVKFVPTINASYVWQTNDRTFHLQEYCEGEIFSLYTAPKWLLKDSAKYLGIIHRELQHFTKLKSDFETGWSKEKDAQNIVNLISRAKQFENVELKNTVLNDLEFKLKALEKINFNDIDFMRLTKSNSHGDFHIGQLICKDNKVKGIIDFSAASYQPIIWEIIRSYTYADPHCKQAQINIENFKNYIKTYLQYFSITKYDLEAMPILYYYQLTRSTYGYKQLLSDNYVCDSSLTSFAFWRTEMCRWLEKNASTLSKELVLL